METKKPTSEELLGYFRTKRKYFDELAKYYYNTDVEFYKEIIAPIYITSQTTQQNVLTTSSTYKRPTKTKTSTATIVISIIVVFGVLLIIGIVSNIKTNSHKVEKEKASIEKTDYEKGVENFNDKLYTSAIRSFEKISENDSLYTSAQDYITKCNDKLDEGVKKREEEEKQKAADEKKKVELEKKYKKIFDRNGWIHEKQSKLLNLGFREYQSGFEKAPDGSQQIKTYYKKYEYGFYIYVSLQYSYSLEHHYVKVWVEKNY